MITYDPKLDRFRNSKTGKYVKGDEIEKKYAQRSIETSQGVVRKLGVDLARGDLTTAAWKTQMRAEIKAEAIRQYTLGRGGIGMMTKSDWGRVGAVVAEQYKFLEDFAKEAKDMEGTAIGNRASMYINSTREAYHRGRYKTMVDSGRSKVKWILSGKENSCTGCIALANRGYMKIEQLSTFPGAGQTECLTKCGCTLRYQK